MKKFLLAILIVLAMVAPSLAAVTATTVWEYESNATAGNINSCAFDPGVTTPGTDWSQFPTCKVSWKALSAGTCAQASPTNTVADLTCTNVANSVCTSATYNFVAADVGNSIVLVSGTHMAAVGSRWIITSVATNAATMNGNLSDTVANATAITANMGGACSLGSAVASFTDQNISGQIVARNTVYVKNGTYTLGAHFSVTAAGTISTPISIVGYVTDRTTIPYGTDRPVFTTPAASGFLNLYLTNGYVNIYNLEATTSSTETDASVVTLGGSHIIVNCKIHHGNAAASKVGLNVNSNTMTKIINSEIYTAGTGTASHAISALGSYSSIIGSYIHGSAGDCIDIASSAGYINILDSIIGPDCGTYGISLAGTNTFHVYKGNTFFGPASGTPTTPASIGIYSAATTFNNNILINNIFYGWTAGITLAGASAYVYDNWNAYYNNTVDITSSYVTKGVGDLTVAQGGATAIFTNAPTDLSINGTNGADLKAKGIPGVPGDSNNFAGLTTTKGYMDMGAVQRVEPAASSGGGAWTF